MKIINHKIDNRVSLTGLACAFVASMSLCMMASQVSAHGFVSSPKSRVIQCKEDGVESPKHPACIAAKAAGNMGLYTPDEVAIIGVKDNHRDYIPDGRLCSANRRDLFGMDLARNDWKATSVTPGPRQFVWTNSAQHQTRYFRYYITRDGFDPTQPLKWDDLDLIHDSGRAGREAVSRHTVDLPYRTGRHIVYSIWQREWTTDAPEAFYQCIDVDFGGVASSSAPSSVASSVRSSVQSSSRSSVVSSVASSSPRNICDGLPVWDADVDYNGGAVVQHNNRRYQANWWTRGQNPSTNSGQWGAWLDAGDCVSTGTSSAASSVVASVASSSAVSSVVASVASSSAASSVATGNCSSTQYVDGSQYATGALVQNGGSEYRCTVGGWCSQGGAYAPGTGWAWVHAWSLVRSCQ